MSLTLFAVAMATTAFVSDIMIPRDTSLVRGRHPLQTLLHGAQHWEDRIITGDTHDRLRRFSLTGVLMVAMIALLLELVRHHDYLLFHGLVEMAAVVVAGAVFVLVLAVRRALDNGALLLIGLAYGGVTLIDLLHVLTYPGMPADGGSADRATQFWVAARLLEAGALALAPLFAAYRLRTMWVLMPVVLVTAGLIVAIHPWAVFPTCQDPVTGLTGFKIGAEIVICVLLGLAALGFLHQRNLFHPRVLSATLAALAFSLVGEILFTLYASPYCVINALGHYSKFISFVCVYCAVIRTIVGYPEMMLHRNLQRQHGLFRSALAHYAAILDSMDDPVCIIGPGRRILYRNAAMDRLFGSLPHNSSCHCYLRRQSAPCGDCVLEEVLRGGGRRREVRISDHDYDVIETPLWSDDEPPAKLSIYRDITDKKRVRMELLRHERELAEALKGTQRHAAALVEVNRELEYMTSMLSHDLRAPLRMIRTYLDLLGEELVGHDHSEASDFCARIDEAVGHAQCLITGIVALARVDQVTSEHHEVNLSSLAGTVVAELRAAEPERHVRVHIEDGLHAHGDPDLLRLLLTNVIGNAWKYTAGRGCAEITFGASDGRSDTFAVRDSGVGFPPEQAERLFAPFVRAHEKTAFTGHGMGLAIVAKIVRRHGGSIRAESDGVNGASFVFSLPGA